MVGVRLAFALLALLAAQSSAPEKYPYELEVMPGLKLVGQGCHRTLVDGNGREICTGIVWDHDGPCLHMKWGFVGDAGKLEFVQQYFGSACSPPAPPSGTGGFGIFIVEVAKGHVVEVLCDDTDAEQRRIRPWPKAIAACPEAPH